MTSNEGLPNHHESDLDIHTVEHLQSLMHIPFDSYEALHARLEGLATFALAVKHIEHLYQERLPGAEFLTRDDWEMLASLWIYDPETADHSVETYRIARERIDMPFELKEHAATIHLSQEFSKEGVSREEFLRACLLHDVGKLAMPIEVLTNHIPDTECVKILFSNYDSLGKKVREALSLSSKQALPASVDDLLQELRRVSVRPQSLVPVRLMLSGEAERDAVALDLAHLGLTLDDSLIAIMRKHDTYSRSILAEKGLLIEAELAGAHHRHAKEYAPTPHTITIGALQVSVDLADIIHLADVTQAMRSRRHYKEARSEMVVLATLVEHVSHNLVDPFVTYLWVADWWYRLDHSLDESDPNSKTIKQFLAINRGVYDTELRARTAPERKAHPSVLH